MSSPRDDEAILAALDDFPAAGPGVVFDAHGLPTGEAADQLWPALLLEVESSLDARGWDVPATLFALVGPAQTAARFDAAGLAHRDLAAHAGPGNEPGEQDQDAVMSAMAVVPLTDVPGVPTVELWGTVAPDWAAGLLLAFEGWAVTGDNPHVGPHGEDWSRLPPSQHPNRVEVRHVLLLTRTGRVWTVERRRDQGPDEVASAHPMEMGGFLVDVLRRTLGLPAEPCQATVGQYLGQLALSYTAQSLEHMLGQTPTENVQQALARDELRRELDRLGPAERDELLSAIGVQHLAPAVARMAWLATNKGRRDVPGGAGKVLHRAAHGRVAELETADLSVVLAVARQAGTLDWGTFAATRGAVEILPQPVREHAAWAGDDLVASWCTERVLAPQSDLLRRIGELAGDGVAEYASAALLDLGWADPSLRAGADTAPDTGIGTGGTQPGPDDPHG